MALVLGTNCGFVTTAPTADPLGSIDTINYRAVAFKVTAPAGATKVTEIGWWCDTASEAANFDVGIYSHDAANNRPDTLLGSSLNNAKGTTAGWKVITSLNITIVTNTIYWIGVQLDYTETGTKLNYADSGGQKHDWKISQTSLPSTWGTSSDTYGGLLGFYAVYTTGGAIIPLAGVAAATGGVTGTYRCTRRLVGVGVNQSAVTGVLGDSRRIYSRGDVPTLPASDIALETPLTTQEYTDVATDNSTRVTQTASAEFGVFLFKDKRTTQEQLQITWNGQSSLASSIAAVYLQIYNRISALWETLASNNSSPANTDFNLVGSLVENLGNYYDTQLRVSCRVYQSAVT